MSSTARTCLAAAVVAAMSAHAPAAAQQRPTSIVTAFGVEQTANKNPGASPYPYEGIGFTGGLRFARRVERAAWDVELGGSRATLHSSISQGGRPREVLTGIRLGSSYARRVGSGNDLLWYAGTAAELRVNHVRHDYGGQFPASDDFGFLAITVGPALHTQLRVQGSTLTNRISLPVASWVDYPYSNAKAHGAALRLDFATLNRLQVVDDELTYRTRPESRVSWRYRLSFFRFALTEPRVTATQSLELQLGFPLGASR